MCRHHFGCSPLYPVFAATTAVNMTTCILKDREFTRMFANVAKDAKPKASLPKLTYLLFAIRDSLTIMASFSMVPYVGTWIHKGFGNDAKSGTKDGLTKE